MELHLESIRDGYREVLTRVLDDGDGSGNTLEVMGMTLVVRDPTDSLPTGTGRKLHTPIAAAEALQLIAGRSKPSLLTDITPGFAEFMDNGKFHGAYGPRIINQRDYVVTELLRDPRSRRAIMTIWNPEADRVPGLHDYPCTTSIQFFVRQGELMMHVYMRSNDVWRGLAYDAFQFTQLQASIADELGYIPGVYRHTAGSMHLYHSDVPAADAMLQGPTTDTGSTVPLGALTVDEAQAILCGHDWSTWQLVSPLHEWYLRKLERYLTREH